MNNKYKTLLIGLLFLIYVGAMKLMGMQSGVVKVEKIIPASAFFALKKINSEGNSNICYRVLLEFKAKITISNAERETLFNYLFFKNFCIADVRVQDIFRWNKNKAIRQIYVLNQINSYNVFQEKDKQTIIGIIDRGCDWKNKCFMKGDGTESRIIYLWDQNAKEGQPDSDIPYGIEYRKRDIQASINSQCNLIPFEAGHGWIIAAIAAGNVTIFDDQNHILFPGKFPEFPIIMVNTTGKMTALIDAISYITRRAAQMNARCVINFAYCKHIGPHDSGDMYLRAIDALLNENSLLVASAGNEGMKNIYTRKEMSSTTQLEFKLDKSRFAAEIIDKTCQIEFEAWYSGSLLDKVSLISPRGKIYKAIGKGKYEFINSTDGSIFIANSPENQAEIKRHCVFVSITSSNGQSPQDGKWTLLFEKKDKFDNKIVEAWITKSEGCDTQFKNEGQLKNTISFLAFGKKVISVGAWQYTGGNVIKEADFSNNPGKTTNYPSQLPTVLTAGRVKVEIPGYSEPMFQEGSSVSTALITRYIAGAWNDNPKLKASDFKKNLNGAALTFGTVAYQWGGLPIYRLIAMMTINWDLNSSQKVKQ